MMTRRYGVFARETNSTDVKKQSDDEAYKLSHAPQFKSAEQFIKAKLKMLREDFCIHPTETEIKHLHELATENQINCAVRQIINNHWK